MAKSRIEYTCQNCGYHSASYLGRCPNCQAWNQFVETKKESAKVSSKATPSRRMTTTGIRQPQHLKEITSTKENRTSTQFDELDRVLGGGAVKGSLVLLGGDPGIGKSTLLLQVCGELAQKQTVLYVSGEESPTQIKMRAQRLGIDSEQLYIFSETDMSEIRQQVNEMKPDFLIIDSIQTMNEPELDAVVGSVSQVKEVTSELMKIAKNDQITVFVVGHVTKSGGIAGPKILEHMVDTVLYFEGEAHHAYRIIRSVKNRFGAANEIGMFEMKGEGLAEVKNPSAIFLDERLPNSTGSAVVVSMEGTRPILVELQALVTPTAFGNAKRTSTGLNTHRVALIMAVLEKRGGLLLQNQDAFLKATGGVRLDEPAIDLAIAVAIASSYKEKEINQTDCFIGEIGLTGEIRRVTQIEDRIKEARNLGFKRVYIPKNNLTESLRQSEGIEIVPVVSIQQALNYLF